MAGEHNNPGGYNIEFVEALDARLRCLICKFVLRSPFQTECGHRYCESCIKNVIDNGNQKCPEDNTELSHQQIFRDGFCNREILELQCFCTNKNLGCEWTGKLRTLEEHYKDCLFLEVTCPNEGCNVKMHKPLLEEHMEKDCKFKKIPYEYCGLEQPQQFMEEHFETTCTKYPLVCQKGCGEKVPREEMENHLETTCSMVGQPDSQIFITGIPNKPGGYNIEFVIKLDPTFRCPICCLALRSPMQTACGHRYCESCIKNVINSGNQKCPLDKTKLSLQQVYQDGHCNRDILELQCFCTKKNLGCKWTGHLKVIEEHYKDCLFLEATCPNEGCNVKMLKGNLGEHMKEECKFKKQPQPIMEISGAQLADHDEKIKMLETTSYDGTFFWNIDDFGRRLQDAVAGRCLSIYSPHFYVGRVGYKVTLIIHSY